MSLARSLALSSLAAGPSALRYFPAVLFAMPNALAIARIGGPRLFACCTASQRAGCEGVGMQCNR